MLKVGDIIPHFESTDANGNFFSTANYIGNKPIVIYFYPMDHTPGCTTQACSFRDQYQDFTDLGAEVIGISADSEKSHQKFATKHKLPFILLSDSSKKLRKLFGVKPNFLGLLPGRVTFVANKEGKIVLIFDSMNATKHIPKAFEAIKKCL